MLSPIVPFLLHARHPHDNDIALSDDVHDIVKVLDRNTTVKAVLLDTYLQTASISLQGLAYGHKAYDFGPNDHLSAPFDGMLAFLKIIAEKNNLLLQRWLVHVGDLDFHALHAGLYHLDGEFGVNTSTNLKGVNAGTGFLAGALTPAQERDLDSVVTR